MILRCILIAVISILPFLLHSQVNFQTSSFQECVSQAESDSKPFMVYFFADWCLPCQLMEETTFQDGKVVEAINTHMKSYKVEFNSKAYEKWENDFSVTCLPTTIFFDAEGNIVERVECGLSSTCMLAIVEEKSSYTDYANAEIQSDKISENPKAVVQGALNTQEAILASTETIKRNTFDKATEPILEKTTATDFYANDNSSNNNPYTFSDDNNSYAASQSNGSEFTIKGGGTNNDLNTLNSIQNSGGNHSPNNNSNSNYTNRNMVALSNNSTVNTISKNESLSQTSGENKSFAKANDSHLNGTTVHSNNNLSFADSDASLNGAGNLSKLNNSISSLNGKIDKIEAQLKNSASNDIDCANLLLSLKELKSEMRLVKNKITNAPSNARSSVEKNNLKKTNGLSTVLSVGNYEVQLGLFRNKHYAERLHNRIDAEMQENVFIVMQDYRGETMYRVVLGSFETKETAISTYRRVKKAGYKAFVKSI